MAEHVQSDSEKKNTSELVSLRAPTRPGGAEAKLTPAKVLRSPNRRLGMDSAAFGN